MHTDMEFTNFNNTNNEIWHQHIMKTIIFTNMQFFYAAWLNFNDNLSV